MASDKILIPRFLKEYNAEINFMKQCMQEKLERLDPEIVKQKAENKRRRKEKEEIELEEKELKIQNFWADNETEIEKFIKKEVKKLLSQIEANLLSMSEDERTKEISLFKQNTKNKLWFALRDPYSKRDKMQQRFCKKFEPKFAPERYGVWIKKDLLKIAEENIAKRKQEELERQNE